MSREIEFALPREMNEAQGIELARDFVRAEFVSRGMVADLNVHWDVGSDGQPKPHAHVMLTMREVGVDGFGRKVRDWNRAALVEEWRERWADHVHARLAELDIDASVDWRRRASLWSSRIRSARRRSGWGSAGSARNGSRIIGRSPAAMASGSSPTLQRRSTR